jgi:hypothetical protein
MTIFDARNPPENSVFVPTAEKVTASMFSQRYDHLVTPGKTAYFVVGDGRNVSTVSVTSDCIIFCAYVLGKNEKITASGVYHWFNHPAGLEEKLKELIGILRPSGDDIVVKIAGSYLGSNKQNERMKKEFADILLKQNVSSKNENFIFGGPDMRVTEFYPRTGNLVTYFDRHEVFFKKLLKNYKGKTTI